MTIRIALEIRFLIRELRSAPEMLVAAGVQSEHSMDLGRLGRGEEGKIVMDSIGWE